MQHGQSNSSDSIGEQLDALLSWWALSGVDGAVTENPVNWLISKPQAPLPDQPGAPFPLPHPPPDTPFSDLPDTVAAFHEFLTSAQNLPENRWPGKRILPTGRTNRPRLMIIMSAPDARTAEEGGFLTADAMALLSGMLRAIGLDPAECCLCSLSIVAPPGGLLDSEMVPPLTERMRHYIGLTEPEAVLLAGDQTNRAFGPTNTDATGNSLQFISYDGGKVCSAAILHPRLMLEQPTAKAGAWRALRTLIRDWKH